MASIPVNFSALIIGRDLRRPELSDEWFTLPIRRSEALDVLPVEVSLPVPTGEERIPMRDLKQAVYEGAARTVSVVLQQMTRDLDREVLVSPLHEWKRQIDWPARTIFLQCKTALVWEMCLAHRERFPNPLERRGVLVELRRLTSLSDRLSILRLRGVALPESMSFAAPFGGEQRVNRAFLGAIELCLSLRRGRTPPAAVARERAPPTGPSGLDILFRRHRAAPAAAAGDPPVSAAAAAVRALAQDPPPEEEDLSLSTPLPPSPRE